MSATHWRIRFPAGGVYIWLAEVKFFGPGGAAIAATGTPLSGGDYSGAYGKAQAFDGVENDANGGWSSDTVPAWIGMQFPSAAEVRRADLIIHPQAASNSWPMAGQVVLENSNDGVAWSAAGPWAGGTMVVSGVFAAGGTLSVFELVPPPVAPVPRAGRIQGRERARYTVTDPLPRAGRAGYDLRQAIATTGTITDRVVVKAGASELPFANALVRAERLADGYRAWAGYTDADGYYTARGLEIGVEYVMLAIDPTRQHKATAAGPVMAT